MFRFLNGSWRNQNEKDYLEELGVYGRMIIKWILRK
jgi:hypothetical protein